MTEMPGPISDGCLVVVVGQCSVALRLGPGQRWGLRRPAVLFRRGCRRWAWSLRLVVDRLIRVVLVIVKLLEVVMMRRAGW